MLFKCIFAAIFIHKKTNQICRNMSYIQIDKNKLINLNYSLSREKLRTNRAGSYASSTIINCNTRKYHGLLVVPQPLIDDQNHVLLSDIDENIIVNNYEFHLGSRMYQGGVMEPKGHKYIKDYTADPNPRLLYRLGTVEIVKEMIFAQNEDRILFKYLVQKSDKPITLQIRPFLAYRSVHSLSKSNTWVDNRYKPVKNGAMWQMYRGYSKVFMQFSKKPEYVHVPDWYYNVEYRREKERGYDYLEDLYTPGYFELSLKEGESIVISTGLSEKNPATFKRQFAAEVKKRTPRDSFEHCLENAAEEFIIRNDNRTEVVAGYPWFGRWGRDTFIALAGLTLTRNDKKSFHEVMKTMISELKDGLFPNLGHGKEAAYNAADTSLWFFRALQQYKRMTGEGHKVWKSYGKTMANILNHYKKGTHHKIALHDNGLIWSGVQGTPVTWMDAVVNGKPVTGRTGFAVEINALWYNALKFALELAEEAGDTAFVNKWNPVAEKTAAAFIAMFWDDEQGYLADYTTYEYKNFDVRPNMVIAASLPYSPLTLEMKHNIYEKAYSELFTPRGLRSLSPKNPAYKGIYAGNQAERDLAYHQGTAWPWLLGPLSELAITVYGKNGKERVKEWYHGFEPVMTEAGIGTVSEIYDGDPPHEARGAISQAWSIAELLRMKWMMENL